MQANQESVCHWDSNRPGLDISVHHPGSSGPATSHQDRLISREGGSDECYGGKGRFHIYTQDTAGS